MRTVFLKRPRWVFLAALTLSLSSGCVTAQGQPAVAQDLQQTANSLSSKPEPSPVIFVPAPCADVWPVVFRDFDPSWQVTVREPRREDEELPLTGKLEAFLASVNGLTDAVAMMDRLDQDIFYVRVHTRGLAELKARYPEINTSLLEKAKVQACTNALAH